MVSSYTTNKNIEKPANGDYNNTWSTPVNSDWDIIDKAFGGTTSINAVGASGTVALTTVQYQAPIVIITGTLTANVNYQLPAGVGGFWYIFNNTSGAFSVLFSSASGGSTVTLPQGYTVGVISDGTNIGFSTTNAALISSTYANPSWITSLAASKLTGAVAVVNGGTGQTSYTDGQLLIGNSTGNTLTKATLTAGTGIAITNTAGGISIATSASGGTVTSVNASTAISGLSFTGGPVTTTGTLTLSGTLGVQGGGTGTTSLTSGAVLIGAGTSAVTSVSPSTAGNVLTSNGSAWVSQASAGGGSVTSVNASTAINGLSFTGGPVTTTGTLTLSGILGVQGGGTGITSLTSGAVLIGAGTAAVTSVSPSTAGNVLTSNGSAWVSQAPSGGGAVSSVSGSGSGISVSPTTGAVVVSNTGVTSIVAGTNVTISGATGAVTINATSSGGSGTFSANDGTVASPSIFFTSDTNTGIYRVGADTLGFAAGGVFSGAIIGTATGNLRLGYNAGPSASGSQGVYLGTRAGESVTSGINNVCVGFGAGATFTIGTGNTLVGVAAGNATTGDSNTCIGANAGAALTSGQNNIIIGANAAASSSTTSNEITLGNASMTLFRCNVTTITSLSDARDKKDIADLNAGLGFINALRPVQFTWDMRPTTGMDGEILEGRKGDPDTGFLAQDLKAAQVATGITIPGLVYDDNPEKLEAGYGKLLPVLVKAIQELSAKVEALEAQLGRS